MIMNMLCLVVLLIAGYAIAVSEKELLRGRKLKDPVFYETVEFWKNFVSNPVRASALAVVLICQTLSIFGIILAMIIFFFVSYYLAKYDLLAMEDEDWEDENLKRGFAAIIVSFAIISFMNALSEENLLTCILGVIVASVIVTGTIALVKNRKQA